MKHNKRIIKALIFDFDGLILDTETPGYNSWKDIFKNLGYNLKFQDWAPKIGNPLHDTENKILFKLKKTPTEKEQNKVKRFRQKILRKINSQDNMKGSYLG